MPLEKLKLSIFQSIKFLFLFTPLLTAPALALDSGVALAKLLEGHHRFFSGKLQHPDQSRERIREVAKAQHPFATILGCADSRVSPEILFDQGIGDLFVIREAGNVTDDVVVGNIEYGVEHLHTPLVVVLGHTHCGAAEAAAHGNSEGHIAAIVKELEPAVALARHQRGDLVDNIVRNNVKLIVQKLRRTGPFLDREVNAGKVQIIGAVYDIDNGKISILNLDEDRALSVNIPAKKP